MRVVVTYIQLLFLHIKKTLDYDYPIFHSIIHPQVLLALSLHLTLLGPAAYLFRRSRKTGNGLLLPVSFGIAWFYLTLSVESSVIPIKDVIFEHRLYLPSVGAMKAIVTGLFYISKRAGLKRWFFPASVVLLLLLSSATFQRNRVWKDPFTLWSDVVKKSPYNSRAHNNIGTAFEKSGRIEDAVSEYREVLRLRPDSPDTYFSLGVAYGKVGRLEDAVLEYKEALKLKPEDAEAHNSLGNIYDDLGRIEDAVLEYREALRLNPNYMEAYYNIGIVYKKKGLKDEAMRAFENALRISPDSAEARRELGYLNRQ